ncbi:hypothetical protein LL912_00700 [Niabella sp. CC-SYL272]|uniref:hypothetical protein n=1 Tax=Niabella agricola TaxID=2891571 RepID=UPI001F4548AE|nr:hypothetical protein [Niabella agricola]MCF3107285.1 hypothetical protein [Niabella agricola]
MGKNSNAKEDEEFSGYDLSRNWFDWSFENPEMITPTHTALYFFIIEHCNRLGWKRKFGLPSKMTMDAIGVKNHKTFKKAFDDLVEWGFIIVVEKSKNQYSANIIALVKNTKACTKALTKASLKHLPKQVHGTAHSTVDIDKPRTIEPINLEPNNKDSGDAADQKKVVGLYALCVEYWLKEAHVGWSMDGVQGSALKSILKKLGQTVLASGRSPTDEIILQEFKMLIRQLPEWFKDKNLNVVNGKYDEIVTQIKNSKNGNSTTRHVNKYAARLGYGTNRRSDL